MDKGNQGLNLDSDYVADLGVPFICPTCNELFENHEYLNQHTDICHGLRHEVPGGNERLMNSSKEFTTHQDCQAAIQLCPENSFLFHHSFLSPQSSNLQSSTEENDHPVLSYSSFPMDLHDNLPNSIPLTHQSLTGGPPHLPLHHSDALLSSTTEKSHSLSQVTSIEAVVPIKTEVSHDNIVSSKVGLQSPDTRTCLEYEAFNNQWFLNQLDNSCPNIPTSEKFSDVFEEGNPTLQITNYEHIDDCQLPDKASASTEVDIGTSSPSAMVSLQSPLIGAAEMTAQQNFLAFCHVCEDCGKSFAQKSDLIAHVHMHTGEKPFVCEACGQKFSYKSNLKKHYRTHTQEKPYHCTICGVSFSQISGLKVHSRTHTGEKPFECSECGQRFSSNGNMRKHHIIHTGEKPFVCRACGRRFSTEGALKAHAKSHTGEKTYQCPVCAVSFSQKGGLEAHFRTHTGEKPFHCHICGLTFARKGGLRVHLRTHTGEKPFVCSHCGQAFGHKSNLNAHIRIHTGEKPFCCPDCDLKFAHRSNLKKHMKSHEEKISSSPAGSLSDSNGRIGDSPVAATSTPVISAMTKMTSFMLSSLSDDYDSKFFDMLDIVEHPSSQACLEI